MKDSQKDDVLNSFRNFNTFWFSPLCPRRPALL